MTTRKMTYCDVCGKEMSVLDADGDMVVTGYQLARPAGGNYYIHYSQRTRYGSSSHGAEVFFGDMCSEDCLSRRMNAMLRELRVNLEVVSTVPPAV